MNPKVSVNLCCYNSGEYLRETIQSVIDQTYTDWELVVINDGSTDSTESIILEFKNKGYPIIYHCQENQGLGASRNKALNLSRGDYIAFIDHDDMWSADKLARQVSVFEKNPGVDFVYSNVYFLYTGHKKLFSKKRMPDGYIFEKFLYHYPVGILTVMLRKEALDRLDHFFDEKLKLSEDFDLFMRLLNRSKALYIDEPLAAYRIHSNMSSLRFIEKWPDEMAYIIEKLKRIDTSIETKHRKALNYINAKIGYYRARTEMLKDNRKEARRYLNPYKWADYKFIVLFLMTFFPSRVWHRIHTFLGIGTYYGGLK